MPNCSLETELRDALRRVTAGGSLNTGEMERLVGHLMNADLESSPYNLLSAGLLCALKTRGESADEVVGAALCLGEHQREVSLNPDAGPLLDTCGTGGDGAHLINISTLTGLVVASMGVRVAKHGNRSVSSACGSADLLEALGYPLLSEPESVARCIEKTGFGFLYAPHFHPALKNLASLRRTLGVRTLFNMLGPLVNPGSVTHQLLGVFSPDIVRVIAEASGRLGVRRCLVVHGEGGLDELSPNGKTRAALCEADVVTEMELTPNSFGAEPVELEALKGGSPERNAEISLEMLRGKNPEVARAVAMNVSAALWLVGRAGSFESGYSEAYEQIMSGRVESYLRLCTETATQTG